MLTAVLVLAASFAAQDQHPAPLDPSGKPFEMLTRLVGDWEMADDDKDGKSDGTVSYRVTSNGFAVAETLFGGTDYEMITMYAFDGAEIVMTHYCAMGNQPRLVGERKSDNTMHFKFKDGTNIDPKADTYMGEMTLTIVDADHIRHEWKSFSKGADAGTVTFDFTRVKK